MNIGKAIKNWRIKRNLKQEQLAELSSLSVSYISLLERNARGPRVGTLAKIAQALDVPLFLILFEAEGLTALEGRLDRRTIDLIAREILTG